MTQAADRAEQLGAVVDRGPFMEPPTIGSARRLADWLIKYVVHLAGLDPRHEQSLLAEQIIDERNSFAMTTRPFGASR